MKYIPADKLVAEIERRLKIVEPHKDTFESAAACRQELIWMKNFIDSLQQECPDQSGCVWIHKKYNREYRIVSDNARLKNSNGEWIDCVIYAPLYENEFEMFAREKDSFYKEFEKK